ncbi:MAG: GNAT family N-acetyltransferase [Acidimicrobiales bacterium]|nr:GNAT family N-acetyltransferase [Acidimicrobiales bacterium]
MVSIDEFVVRPIDAADTHLLIAAHDQLSPEARRLRFFRPHPVMSEEEASYFTHVDHVDREAFVATWHDQIVAVARYDRVGPDEAEIAFVVGDDFQGHGLATTLLDRLAEHAREVGITRFVADTFGDNRAAIGLLRHWAPNRKASIDSGFMHFEMEIAAA